MKFDKVDLLSHLATRQKLSAGTITTRVCRIHLFSQWAGEREINPTIIEGFFYYLKTVRKLSNTSLNVYYHSLISLERYLIDREGIKPFMQGFSKFQEEEPNKEPLSKEEVELLIATPLDTKHPELERVNVDMTIFLAHTGARWEDAQSLQCRNVDLISKKVTYIQLKSKRKRSVFFTDPLLSVLLRRTYGRSPDDLVFINTAGNKMHYPDFHENVALRAKKAGITKPVSPHILRHSYAQLLYDEKSDLLLVRDVLGHAHISSTERYAKNSEKRIKVAQLTHPIVIEKDPHYKIMNLEERIREYHFQDDPQFDAIRIQEAFKDFIISLHKAVKT